MIVLLSLIVLLHLVSMIFHMVLPIPTSPFIQLNDFCTCIYMYMYMYIVYTCTCIFVRNASGM